MPRGRRSDWTPHHQDVAEYLYKRGLSTRAIGDLFGIHYNTVGRYLAGVGDMERLAYRQRCLERCKDDLARLGLPPENVQAALESVTSK